MSRRPVEVSGSLTFQEGKKIDGEYFIVSVYDDPDLRRVNLVTYELETDNTFVLMYTYSEFDSLFRFNADLINPNNTDGRYHWAIERLDFIEDDLAGVKKLCLAIEPTKEEDSAAGREIEKDRSIRGVMGGTSAQGVDAALRTKLIADLKGMDSTSAQVNLIKSEGARKTFLQEIFSKLKLEQLKSQQRILKIDENREERRERMQGAKLLLEEKALKFKSALEKRTQTVADIEKMMRKKEEETVRRLLKRKEKDTVDKERKHSEALNKNMNKEETLKRMKRLEIEKSLTLETKREETSQQRIQLHKRLAREQAEKIQKRIDMENKAKQRLHEARNNRLNKLEKECDERSVLKIKKTTFLRKLGESRKMKEELRERLRREIECERINKLKASFSSKMASHEINLNSARRNFLYRHRDMVTKLREQRRAIKLVNARREEKIAEKLAIRQRKLDERTWQASTGVIVASENNEDTTTLDRPDSDKEKFLASKQRELRRVERETRNSENMIVTETTLAKTEKVRREIEIKKFMEWKDFVQKRHEIAALQRFQKEENSRYSREQELKSQNQRYSRNKNLEEIRAGNDRLREQARHKKIAEKVSILQTASALPFFVV